ncbi:Uncharacterized protein TCM_005154 [Theobroma cacao]|uniref:Uncharacterized protein n=1 Tax=Theobroma cacao TaxID=3641 RepID=A0A061DSP5_THECC|nr:Uncharacterized protein TCM_005154 [Theobroma cacao]
MSIMGLQLSLLEVLWVPKVYCSIFSLSLSFSFYLHFFPLLSMLLCVPVFTSQFRHLGSTPFVFFELF